MDTNRDAVTRQIAMVRLTGACNMFDSPCVQRLAHDMELHDLVMAIGDRSDSRRDRKVYMECLMASGDINIADLDDDEQAKVREANGWHLGEDDDFSLQVEYDGLYGAPDYLVEQSAQDEEMHESGEL